MARYSKGPNPSQVGVDDLLVVVLLGNALASCAHLLTWASSIRAALCRLCKQVYFMDVQTSTYDGMASQGLNTLRLVGITTINDGVGSRMMETRIESNVVLWNRQGVAMPYPTGLSKALPPAQLSTSGHPCECP